MNTSSLSRARVQDRVEAALRRHGAAWVVLLLALRLALFGYHAARAPAALGDETFTVGAVEELGRRGDLLVVLRGKRHHPFPYLLMARFASRGPERAGADAVAIPAGDPVLL